MLLSVPSSLSIDTTRYISGLTGPEHYRASYVTAEDITVTGSYENFHYADSLTIDSTVRPITGDSSNTILYELIDFSAGNGGTYTTPYLHLLLPNLSLGAPGTVAASPGGANLSFGLPTNLWSYYGYGNYLPLGGSGSISGAGEVTSVPSQVPEPSGILLLGSGLAGLSVWGGKKFKCI